MPLQFAALWPSKKSFYLQNFASIEAPENK
jgi:hypothetical protein